jgi:hypothetical protein
MVPDLIGPCVMQLRLTFIDTHVRTCETEAPDDLDLVDLNKLSEFVYGEIEAAGADRWAEVVDANWIDSQIVDVKVKNPDVKVKNPDNQWVGLEKLRPRVGVDIRTPPPAAPPVPSPAPALQPTLF